MSRSINTILTYLNERSKDKSVTTTNYASKNLIQHVIWTKTIPQKQHIGPLKDRPLSLSWDTRSMPRSSPRQNNSNHQSLIALDFQHRSHPPSRLNGRGSMILPVSPLRGLTPSSWNSRSHETELNEETPWPKLLDLLLKLRNQQETPNSKRWDLSYPKVISRKLDIEGEDHTSTCSSHRPRDP